MIKKISICLIVILFSFSFLEIFSRILFKKEFENFDKRVMLYSENKTFVNIKNFFIYKPNTKFKSVTIYKDKTTNQLIEEYNFNVLTNNAGLVQLKNIVPNKESIFILGASETKGQGATPWFYDIEKEYLDKNSQIINLGMIGTGPAQQKILFEFIKKKYSLKVKKIIIIFSSGYFTRGIWNYNTQQLSCLKKNKNCIGTEGIYGFDFKNQNSIEFAQNVVNARMGNLNSFHKSIEEKNYFQSIKEIAKKSYFIKKSYLVLKIYKSKNLSNQNNFKALNDLNQDYSNKLYLIHMQGKNEAKIKSVNLRSIEIKKWLEEKKIITNYNFCKIPYIGFHFNDSHANIIGYTFLKKCVKQAIYD